jgi:hypothetical protein
MTSQSIYSEYFGDSFSHAAADLLEAIMLPNEAAYPWNPGEANSEAYLASLEREFELQEWSEEDISSGCERLFSQLHECWTSEEPEAQAVKMSLYQRFAAYVPESWIDAIAQKATEICSAKLSLADQLVQCVNSLLPYWAEEDLQVLARPLACAMRGADAEAVESALSVVRQVDWTELSEMEQARVSMAIARSALANLNNGIPKGV